MLKQMIVMLTKSIDRMHIRMITDIHIAIMIKPFKWWLDFGTTVHVCDNHQQFKSYEDVENKEVMVDNGNSTKVQGIGSVDICFTSEKKLCLANILFVHDLNKNLLFVSSP